MFENGGSTNVSTQNGYRLVARGPGDVVFTHAGRGGSCRQTGPEGVSSELFRVESRALGRALNDPSHGAICEASQGDHALLVVNADPKQQRVLVQNGSSSVV